MPSERALAAALGTSRTTVGAAYSTLVDNGYLTTRARARATVRLPAAAVPAPAAAAASATIDLSCAAPPAPMEILEPAFVTALRRLPRHADDFDPYGIAVLRTAVAGWYGRRGLITSPDHIMITHGEQHALSLLARTLVSPRDRVLIDHPTHPHAIEAFTAAGADLLPVAVTPAGWDVGRLRAAGRSAALAYLVPDFHDPTGMCMPDDVRRRLDLACPTIVDETMADLALDTPNPEPLALHMPGAISIGSVSKSVWGGLRIGWIRALPSVLHRVARIRPASDLGPPVVEQLATAVLLDERRTRRPAALQQLRSQRDALSQALSDVLPGVSAPRPAGGMTQWVTFPEPVGSRLEAIAPDHGVIITAGTRFGVGGAFERNVRLPYTLPPGQLTQAVHRLASAAHALAPGRPSSIAS